MTVRDFCFDVDPDTKINLIKFDISTGRSVKEVCNEYPVAVRESLYRDEEILTFAAMGKDLINILIEG